MPRTPNLEIDPEAIRYHASRGLTIEFIASEFGLVERKFEAILAKKPKLREAYEVGVQDAKKAVWNRLWEMAQQDKGLMLLMGRLLLKLEDPLLDTLVSGTLTPAIKKLDTQIKAQLATLFGVTK